MKENTDKGASAYESEYENNQEFNAVVSWLHSYRYKNILSVFDDLSASTHGKPIRVVDIGCANAKLYALLKDRFQIDYIGIELNEDFVKAAQEQFKDQSNFSIIHAAAENELCNIADVDIIVALETMEHIPEHTVVRIIEKIAKIKPKLFVCSVPVEIGPAIWLKNIGSMISGYDRHIEYTWKETFWAGLGNLDKLPPHGIGHKGFDWRWLAQTIRHNMRIKEIRKFPMGFLPAGLNASVFFIAECINLETYNTAEEEALAKKVHKF